MDNKKLAEYLANYIDCELDDYERMLPDNDEWLAETILNGLEAFESINDID